MKLIFFYLDFQNVTKLRTKTGCVIVTIIVSIYLDNIEFIYYFGKHERNIIEAVLFTTHCESSEYVSLKPKIMSSFSRL